MVRILVPVALAALTGCATQADHDQLVKCVSELEAKVAELDAKGASKSSARTKASAEDEGKAMELLKELETLIAAGKMTDAKAKVDEIFDKYPSTTAAARAKRTKAELSVVGKAVGAPDIESWFVEGEVDLASGSTLVVFWEIWCPHCRREVPELQATFEKYQGKMDVVGLTRLTKNKTAEEVQKFIDENKVSYPMAKESGKTASDFAVSGIPAAAIVKDGKIVWRGHPGKLTDDLIDKLI